MDSQEHRATATKRRLYHKYIHDVKVTSMLATDTKKHQHNGKVVNIRILSPTSFIMTDDTPTDDTPVDGSHSE